MSHKQNEIQDNLNENGIRIFNYFNLYDFSTVDLNILLLVHLETWMICQLITVQNVVQFNNFEYKTD